MNFNDFRVSDAHEETNYNTEKPMDSKNMIVNSERLQLNIDFYKLSSQDSE